MDDFWLDNYIHKEYNRMNSKEKSLYDSGLIELALYYYDRKSSRAPLKLLALPSTLSNLRQAVPLILQLVQDFLQIAHSLRYLLLLLRSFIGGARYAISTYIDVITEVLEQISPKPVDIDEIRGFVRAITIYVLMLTLAFFLYRPAFYPALFLGLFALPLKFRDLGLLALAAVVVIILLAFALFGLNFLISHFVKVLH